MGFCDNHQHVEHKKNDVTSSTSISLSPATNNLTSVPDLPFSDLQISVSDNPVSSSTSISSSLQQVESELKGVTFFAGSNTNKEGKQEIGEIEVGTSSNSIVSPIFTSKNVKVDINIGHNSNQGRSQKIGGVKFGNVIR